MSVFGWSYPAGAANDPNAPYNQNDDYDQEGATSIISALQDRSTNRWHWDRIHCCLTGKDADLESWGQQGIEFIRIVNDITADCEAHIGFTAAGQDVCLNVPEHVVDEQCDQLLETYLDRAGDLVADGGLGWGQWDGDSWYQSEAIPFSVPIALDPSTDAVLAEATADAIIAAAEERLRPFEEAIIDLHAQLDVLAGWKTRTDSGELIACPEGQPGPDSLWAELFCCKRFSAPASAGDTK